MNETREQAVRAVAQALTATVGERSRGKWIYDGVRSVLTRYARHRWAKRFTQAERTGFVDLTLAAHLADTGSPCDYERQDAAARDLVDGIDDRGLERWGVPSDESVETDDQLVARLYGHHVTSGVVMAAMAELVRAELAGSFVAVTEFLNRSHLLGRPPTVREVARRLRRSDANEIGDAIADFRGRVQEQARRWGPAEEKTTPGPGGQA